MMSLVGILKDTNEMYQHAQILALSVYGGEALKQVTLPDGKWDGNPDLIGTTSFDIGHVAEKLLEQSNPVLWNPKEADEQEHVHLMTQAVMAGSLYAACIWARNVFGCQKAVASIVSNDGDLQVVCWNDERTIAVVATQTTFFGA